jgi:hypothetical protein
LILVSEDHLKRALMMSSDFIIRRPCVARKTKKHDSSERHTSNTSQSSSKAGQVLTRMRQGASLKKASREVGIDPRTVERRAGSALRQARSGRYVAGSADRLQREVRLPARDGLSDVVVRDSKQASLVGDYWNAVHAHLAKGESSGLRRFEGKHVITANGERVPLLADPEVLDELGNAGVLSFESIYAKGR